MRTATVRQISVVECALPDAVTAIALELRLGQPDRRIVDRFNDVALHLGQVVGGPYVVAVEFLLRFADDAFEKNDALNKPRVFPVHFFERKLFESQRLVAHDDLAAALLQLIHLRAQKRDGHAPVPVRVIGRLGGIDTALFAEDATSIEEVLSGLHVDRLAPGVSVEDVDGAVERPQRTVLSADALGRTLAEVVPRTAADAATVDIVATLRPHGFDGSGALACGLFGSLNQKSRGLPSFLAWSMPFCVDCPM